MTGEVVDIKALDETAAEPEPQQAQAQEPPITLHTESGTFVVTDQDSWGYMEVGIFATGTWQNFDEVKDVLIPYERVLYIDFDFSYVESEKAKDEQPAD